MSQPAQQSMWGMRLLKRVPPLLITSYATTLNPEPTLEHTLTPYVFLALKEKYLPHGPHPIQDTHRRP